MFFFAFSVYACDILKDNWNLGWLQKRFIIRKVVRKPESPIENWIRDPWTQDRDHDTSQYATEKYLRTKLIGGDPS